MAHYASDRALTLFVTTMLVPYSHALRGSDEQQEGSHHTMSIKPYLSVLLLGD